MRSEDSLSVLENISGFHRFIFDGSFRLDFASASLCAICGYSKEDFSRNAHLYVSMVHPKDRDKFSEFLSRLSKNSCSEGLVYRLTAKDGRVICVKDNSVSRIENGVMFCDSVLCDVSELTEEKNVLSLLDDKIPFGVLHFTDEKQPRVTYINDKMKAMLRFSENSDGSFDYLEFYSRNIFLMIPLEEQRKFLRFLSKVSSKEAPIAGEISVIRCDGTRARLFGWASRVENENGVEEFQSVCMDITESYRKKRESETKRYLNALTGVYDRIFRYDFTTKTVKYVHSTINDSYSRLLDVPMQLEEATDMWINTAVAEPDRKKVRRFFDGLFILPLPKSTEMPTILSFDTVSDVGETISNTGLFLKVGSGVGLFCIKRDIDENRENLISENRELKNINRNMSRLVMRFTDGIVAFELSGNLVKPLYASDNVCVFFGYSRESWLEMTGKGTPLSEFVSHSGVDKSAFSELLELGEAMFFYKDTATGEKKKIKAVCSEKNGEEPRYVMLYNGGKVGKEQEAAKDSEVVIRTFGYFDVFIGDKPIVFRNRKSKELLALLVDRRGGYVSSEQAISFLWEDEPASAVTLARYRKVALRLKNTLEEYGIRDIVEAVDGNRRIVADKVRCDLFDYLSGKEEYRLLFKGSYLTNYSWGENMLGELTAGQN